MTSRFITPGLFKNTFRADCLTEKKYVGPKRKDQSQAEIDKTNHLSIPGNEDHEVEIERTQRSYLSFRGTNA
jgi:hypothetical protein